MATEPPPEAGTPGPPALPSSPSDPADDHAKIVRSAGVMSAAVLLSRLTGLLREAAFAAFFGAGLAYDAYVGAFRIPNLFRDLLAEGALSSAFVTTFSQHQSRQGESAAFRLSNLVGTTLMPLVGALCLVAVALAPQIVDFMYPGFAEVPGKRELTIQLTRIMVGFLLFVSLAAKAMGVLNARGRFGVPSLASACFNVVSLGSGLALGYWAGPRLGLEPIVGMAYGTLIGGFAQYAFQLPSLRSQGLRYRPVFDLADPGLRQVLRLMGPAVLGAAAIQINVVVNSNFASQIADPATGQVLDGPVSWLTYAFRFMQLPLGLFGVAVASATLPAISRSAAQGDRDGFREMVSRSLGLVFLLTIPSAVGLIVLREPIIGLIFERGRFSAVDTEQTGLALAFYCLGLAGYGAIKVLTPAYYALNDVRIPVMISVFSIGLNLGLNWTFLRVLGWGHWGLALSTSLVALLNFALLFGFLRGKTGGLKGARLSSSVARVSLAAAVMGAACWASSEMIRWAVGDAFWGRAINVTLSVSLGAAVVYGMCRLLNVAELDDASRAILARVRGGPADSGSGA